MSEKQKEEMKRQLEQITCFLDSVYAGMAHDIRIVWRFGAGNDAIGRETTQDVVDHWKDSYGKHEEITIGVGDSYYGSKSISAMLYESAYHMRERINDRLADNGRTGTFLDFVEPHP